MFSNNILLSPTIHGDLRIAETQSWRFAATQTLVPLSYTEMADAAREYPLVFVRENSYVFALTGAEAGKNDYVTDDGRWLANYIPARLRAYPLALTRLRDKPDRFGLALDKDAPQVGAEDGYFLFRNGEQTPFLSKRVALLQAMQKSEPTTRALVDAIRDAGLLADRALRVKRKGAERTSLAGLQVIDEKKLNQLSHEDFIRLRDRGALPLIYAHLLSLASLRQGPLAAKYPQFLITSSGGESSRKSALDEWLERDTLTFS